MIRKYLFTIFFFICLLITFSPAAFWKKYQDTELLIKIKTAVKEGRLSFQLTEAKEVTTLFGVPEEQKKFQDRGMLIQ